MKKYATRILILAALCVGACSYPADAQVPVWVPYQPPKHNRASTQAKIAGLVQVTKEDGTKVTLTDVIMDATDWRVAERMEFTADEACSLLPYSTGEFYGREEAIVGKKPIIQVFYPISEVERISFDTKKKENGVILGQTCAIFPRDTNALAIADIQWAGWDGCRTIQGKEETQGFGKADFSIKNYDAREIRLPAVPPTPIKTKTTLKARVIDVAKNEYELSDVRLGTKSFTFTTDSGSALTIEVDSIEKIVFGAKDSATVTLRSGPERTFKYSPCGDGVGGWDGQHYVFIRFDIVSEIVLANQAPSKD